VPIGDRGTEPSRALEPAKHDLRRAVVLRKMSVGWRENMLRRAILVITLLVLLSGAGGCEKNGRRSTLHKVGDDVEHEIKHAPDTVRHAGNDIDESARDLVGNPKPTRSSSSPPPAKRKTGSTDPPGPNR
jgi:hypothetical protein